MPRLHLTYNYLAMIVRCHFLHFRAKSALLQRFKNRKTTVAHRHVVGHCTGAVWRPSDDRAVTARFWYDNLGDKIVQRS